MKEGCFGDLFDVMVEAEVIVEDDTKVAAEGGGGQCGVVYSEVEILSCLGEGIWTNEDHIRFVVV